MKTRITERDLENVCRRINQTTGNHTEAYTRDASGKYTANIGSYTLSAAYGGWKLEQIVSGGGVRTVSSGGYIPKRELYNQMQAFLSGIEAANN